MKVKYNMVVDFARPTKSNTILISEGDTDSRAMHFTLLFDKQAFDMTDVVSVIVKGITSSGQAIFDSTATIVTDEEGNKLNEIEYVIPADLSNISGTLTVTVTLTSEQGETITSFECYIKVRNALYNEDDVISETDMTGFRELLRKTEAALAKIEDMVQKDALPCPESIRINVDGVEYEYFGKDPVDIQMGFVAYISNEIGEMEETRDDSAAHRAAISEANAKASEEAAALSEANAKASEESVDVKMANIDEKVAQATKSAADSEFYYNNIDQLTPRASVTKDEDTGVTTINISDVTGPTSAEVRDGEPGKDGKNGNRWFRGIVVSGETVTPTAFTLMFETVANDNYINVEEGSVYHCTQGAEAGSPSMWAYDFTMTGGGGGGASSWGSITGNLSDQADLKGELDKKINEPTTEGTDGQVLTTDGNGNRSWKTVKGGQDNYISSVEDTEFNVSEAGKLSLASQITDKLSDIDGKADKSTSLSGYGITDAYTKTQVDNKVDTTVQTSNVTSDGTVTFTGIDPTKCYKLIVDIGTGSDISPVGLDKITINGTTLTYKLTNASSGAECKLKEIKL